MVFLTNGQKKTVKRIDFRHRLGPAAAFAEPATAVLVTQWPLEVTPPIPHPTQSLPSVFKLRR